MKSSRDNRWGTAAKAGAAGLLGALLLAGVVGQAQAAAGGLASDEVGLVTHEATPVADEGSVQNQISKVRFERRAPIIERENNANHRLASEILSTNYGVRPLMSDDTFQSRLLSVSALRNAIDDAFYGPRSPGAIEGKVVRSPETATQADVAEYSARVDEYEKLVEKLEWAADQEHWLHGSKQEWDDLGY